MDMDMNMCQSHVIRVEIIEDRYRRRGSTFKGRHMFRGFTIDRAATPCWQGKRVRMHRKSGTDVRLWNDEVEGSLETLSRQTCSFEHILREQNSFKGRASDRSCSKTSGNGTVKEGMHEACHVIVAR